jgi:hypothetical protein
MIEGGNTVPLSRPVWCHPTDTPVSAWCRSVARRATTAPRSRDGPQPTWAGPGAASSLNIFLPSARLRLLRSGPWPRDAVPPHGHRAKTCPCACGAWATIRHGRALPHGGAAALPSALDRRTPRALCKSKPTHAERNRTNPTAAGILENPTRWRCERTRRRAFSDARARPSPASALRDANNDYRQGGLRSARGRGDLLAATSDRLNHSQPQETM